MTILRAGFGSRSAAYEIAKSLRFRASANPLLYRTGVAGDPKKVTISAWVKLGRIASSLEHIFEAWSTTSRLSGLTISATGSPYFQHIDGTRNIQWISTTALRDPSAWYHLVLQMDFTQASSANAVKLFINGVQDSLSVNVSSGSYAQNMNSYFNTAVSHRHGLHNNTTYTDGYRVELHFLDGILAGPEEFGKTDPVTGQWVPIEYTGAYGTNGHYLDFSDGSSTTTLGYDKSGNGRNFTVSGISLTAGVTYDWMDDTPSNNFCVLSPLDGRAEGALGSMTALVSNGALTLGRNTTASSGAGTVAASMGVSSGKYYFEGALSSYAGSSTLRIGMLAAAGGIGGAVAPYKDVSGNGTYMLAVDLDNLLCWTGTNGVWDAGDPSAGTGGTAIAAGDYLPFVRDNSASSGNGGVWDVNFGQRPFAYTPPTGFLSLCSKNLPTPAVKKGSQYFDAVLAAGAGIKTACEALYGSFFEWIKDRANANNHQLIDSVRGNTAVLQSNATGTETTYSAPGGSSVGWVWRIAAGFLDVVTYTGTGVARTVAHNLGVAPAMVIVTSRTLAGTAWHVYHTSLGALKRVFLERTDAESVNSNSWNDTAPTSSELTVGTGSGVNASGYDYVAYLFAEVPGFSKFGSYTGNGSAAGPFVYCGFKPKFLMIKCASTTGDWWIYDAERSPANPASLKLLANTAGVEDVSGEDVDLLSNGFKIRSTAAGQNTNAATYIFAAFAECPFQYATAR